MTMEAVRSLQEDDVNMLKERFYETGYVTTMPEFFLVCKNLAGESQTVADFVDKWDQAWKDINNEFEKECEAVEEFRILKDQMFWVFDGNHRFTAWSQVANENPNAKEYHPSVRFTLLQPPQDCYKKVEQCMHELNK